MVQKGSRQAVGIAFGRSNHGERLKTVKLGGGRAGLVGIVLLVEPTLPAVALGLLWCANSDVRLGNAVPDPDTADRGIAIRSKCNLANQHVFGGAEVEVAERNLNTFLARQAKGTFLEHHAKLIKDDMLRTELELKVRATSHLKSNGQLVMLLERNSPFLLLAAHLLCRAVGVAYKIVEIFKGILARRKERPERIVVKQRVKFLLVQSVNINVGCNSVALSFGVGQPGLDSTSDTRIVDPMAAFAKRTAASRSFTGIVSTRWQVEERERSKKSVSDISFLAFNDRLMQYVPGSR